jgi:hypothetical protein
MDAGRTDSGYAGLPAPGTGDRLTGHGIAATVGTGWNQSGDAAGADQRDTRSGRGSHTHFHALTKGTKKRGFLRCEIAQAFTESYFSDFTAAKKTLDGIPAGRFCLSDMVLIGYAMGMHTVCAAVFRPDQSDGSGDGAQQPCRISPARRQRAGTICAIFARKDQKRAQTALFRV